MASKVLYFLSLFILVSLAMSDFRNQRFEEESWFVWVNETEACKFINAPRNTQQLFQWDTLGKWLEGEVILSHSKRASGRVALFFWKNILPESYDFQEVVKGRLMAVKVNY